jgi:S-formylglutathione hydrolase FrmB
MATSVEEGTAPAVVEQPGAITVTVPPLPEGTPLAGTDAARSGWRYGEAGKRDLRLDLLRGFAVFAMVVDHIGGTSWLHLLSGGNRFFVSAAEVFVFISGLMVGLIYTEQARRAGFRPTATKLLKRAWTLYALAVWLALATAFAAALFDLPRGVILGQNPARFVFEVLTLQRTFYLVDVMLFYAFAMVVAPLALGLLLRGGWWVVALCSAALWGAYQVWPTALQLPWAIADNPVFNFAAWQILFFGGMLLGSWRGARQQSTTIARPRLSRFLRELPLPAFAVALGALIYVHLTNGSIFAPYIAESDTGVWLDRWFDKSALPFPRLIACVIVFGFLWALVSRCWRPLRKGLGWFLLPLGQGALYAYAAHLFVIIALQIAILQIWGRGRESGYSTPSLEYDTLIQLIGVLAVWGLTRTRFLQQIVAPLGAAPFGTFRLSKLPRRLPRPSDSLAAILVVLLLSLPFLFPLGIGGGVTLRSSNTTANPSAAPASGQASGQPSGAKSSAAPASTVTAPRSVAGSARGSSGYTGRSDQPGASPAPTAAARTGAPTAQPNARPTPLPSTVAAAASTQTAASGGYLKDGAFFSQALGRTMPYGIYLPPTYDSDPNRHYPVVYMLHGAGGHYSEWVAYGLPEMAEDLIWDGQIQPLIIVMPQGDHSYFVNHVGTDGERWGDYIAFDLIAHIDTTYRTIPQPSSRAIGGLSMGGFGALQLAFTHPDIFGAVGAHSPALRTVEQLSDILDPTDAPEDFDPIEVAKAINPTYAPRIWVDTGADDEWADRVVLLGQTLDERGISHEVRLLPGQHSGDYWTARAGDYIRFYARSVVGDNLGIGRTP